MNNKKSEAAEIVFNRQRRPKILFASFTLGLQAVFIGHKLNACGSINTWSWWLVFMPVLLYIGINVTFYIILSTLQVWNKN